MKIGILFSFLFFTLHSILAQNPSGFEKMATNMAGKKAPKISMTEVQSLQNKKEKIIFIDTRELDEYQVSHMENALWVGYDDIDWDKINKLDKKATIIVYCSVGFRSGKLTEQMQKKGFTKVKNLYGGLFNWTNNGGRVVNSRGMKTNEIHGYNKNWSKWINSEKSQIIL